MQVEARTRHLHLAQVQVSAGLLEISHFDYELSKIAQFSAQCEYIPPYTSLTISRNTFKRASASPGITSKG